MKKIVGLAAIVLLFVSCRNEQSSDKTIEAPEKADTITYSYDSVKVYSKHIIRRKTDRNLSDTTEAKISYPVFKNDTLNKHIQRKVLNYFSEEDKSIIAYQDLAKSFIKGYDNFINENKDSQESWFLIIDLDVVYQKEDYIAIRYTHSAYSGGAHPNTNFSFINYNLKTNQPIILDSLIDKSKKDKFLRIAENIFRKDEKLKPTESLAGKYFFNDGKFSLPENFYLSKKGLVFFYNPYEIKAYAYGTTQLVIPFAALKDIAKPNTILSGLY